MRDLDGYTVSCFEEETTSREWRTPGRAPVSESVRTTFTLFVTPTEDRPRLEGLTASDLRAIVTAMDATGVPDDVTVDVEVESFDDDIPMFKCARISWVTEGEAR